MKPTAKTVFLSLSIATVAAAGIIPAAQAATENGNTSPTLETSAKALEAQATRQIVVEPKQPAKKAEIAVLTPKAEETAKTPEAKAPEAKAPEAKAEAPKKEAAANPQPKANEKAQDKAEEPVDVFAPQTKAEPEKVEIPTVFTEKQKLLFQALDVEEQKKVVERLIKKYGKETMYPKATVTAKVVEEPKKKVVENHKKKQTHVETYEHSYNYAEPVYESYSSYDSGYTNCQ